MKSIKDTILERIDDVRKGMNSLRSSDFGNAFFWQVVCAQAETKLKDEWAKLQDPQGKLKLKDDDDMRDLGSGDHVITNSKLFSVTAKIGAGRRTLNVDMLKSAIVRAYPSVRLDKLTEIIEDCKIQGKEQLTKRVVENVR